MSLFAKLWTDILGDEKLMRAARKGGKHLVLTPWLIVFAKKQDDNGRLSVAGEPAEPWDIARQIPGVTASQVAACEKALEEIGVLEREPDGVLCFVAWEKRSGAAVSESAEAVTERVRRYRARKKAQKAEREARRNGVTETKRNGVTVTGETEVKQVAVTTPRARSRELELEKELEVVVGASTVTVPVTSAVTPATEEPTTTTAAALAEQLTTDSARAALELVLSSVPNRPAWIGDLAEQLEREGAETISAALQDFVANGEADRPHAGRFRGYVRRVREAASAATTNGAGSSAPQDEAERKHRLLVVETRRARSDGDLWWNRMQEESPGKRPGDVYAYAYEQLKLEGVTP